MSLGCEWLGWFGNPSVVVTWAFVLTALGCMGPWEWRDWLKYINPFYHPAGVLGIRHRGPVEVSPSRGTTKSHCSLCDPQRPEFVTRELYIYFLSPKKGLLVHSATLWPFWGLSQPIKRPFPKFSEDTEGPFLLSFSHPSQECSRKQMAPQQRWHLLLSLYPHFLCIHFLLTVHLGEGCVLQTMRLLRGHGKERRLLVLYLNGECSVGWGSLQARGLTDALRRCQQALPGVGMSP